MTLTAHGTTPGRVVGHWGLATLKNGTRPVFKFFAWVIGLPIIVIAVFFAISNQESTTLSFWPTEYTAEMPMFWAVLGALLIGLILGVFFAWLSGGKRRSENRRLRSDLNSARRRAEQAEAKLAG
ncbi:lipopolysaccharide assembly protein LapA domain-containing protein [Roseospira navarrensis]|uniref:DUF1049 domain-containing protein n=1 Tax=Roseospira navarrensis TaxID=140058 RepID=A0A7X1ZEM2_9PROT|nr:lipopolysaccharide assembly protein LapA domain-containing protein [Roseospira navarrensis]MQX36882.1 DUF1049 domain-containing protein [Roseospira navarrensis]